LTKPGYSDSGEREVPGDENWQSAVRLVRRGSYVKHEEKHVLGMWLVAAFVGGFAMLLWWVGTLERGGGGDVPPSPVEAYDSTA
jgi:hypothetical protein